MAQWSRFQSEQATKEGWDIFEASGSMENVDGRRPYQIQRWDEAKILDSDSAAMTLVRSRAEAGSALHREAMTFLSEESPAEYETVMAHEVAA